MAGGPRTVSAREARREWPSGVVFRVELHEEKVPDFDRRAAAGSVAGEIAVRVGVPYFGRRQPHVHRKNFRCTARTGRCVHPMAQQLIFNPGISKKMATAGTFCFFSSPQLLRFFVFFYFWTPSYCPEEGKEEKLRRHGIPWHHASSFGNCRVPTYGAEVFTSFPA